MKRHETERELKQKRHAKSARAAKVRLGRKEAVNGRRVEGGRGWEVRRAARKTCRLIVYSVCGRESPPSLFLPHSLAHFSI